MLEILLYIYLAGFVSVAGYGIYECEKNPPKRVITQNECRAGSILTGCVWPVPVGFHIYDECKDWWKEE